MSDDVETKKNDVTRYDEHPAMFRNAPIQFVICLILIPVLGIGLLALGAWYLGTRAVRLKVEDGELQIERGLVSKAYTEMKVDRIRSVRVHQGFWQRILDTGDIEVFTSGDEPEISVRGMPRPMEVRKIVKDATNSRDI